MNKMKLMNNILCFVASIYSIYLVFAYESNIYSILIKLSIIPVIFLPTIVEKIFKIKINTYLVFIYTVFIFIAHFLGSIVNFYHQIYWYDSFAHFISGIVVGFVATYLLVILKKYDKKTILFNILFILGISFMVAGLWEMFEFISDKIFNKDAQNVLTTGVNDTMKDMIVAILGTILYSLLYLYEEVNKKSCVVKKFIESI